MENYLPEEVNVVVIAGPGFVREQFMAFIQEEWKEMGDLGFQTCTGYRYKFFGYRLVCHLKIKLLTNKFTRRPVRTHNTFIFCIGYPAVKRFQKILFPFVKSVKSMTSIFLFLFNANFDNCKFRYLNL